MLQSGSFNVSAALNAGIRKACGEYVSFIFVRRLYQNFLKGYLDSARRYSADFVFGCWDESEIKAAERRLISSAVIGAAGTDYMKEILRGHLNLDISALLFKKSLLTEKHIYFSEDCANGYAEEFIYRTLLHAEHIVQSPTFLIRDNTFELKRGKQSNIGKAIFQYADAMLRIEAIIRTEFRNDRELLDLFRDMKLPQVLLFCIDVLLKEGLSVRSVKSYLKRKEYEKLISSGKYTEVSLRGRIHLWRRVPWMYRPK